MKLLEERIAADGRILAGDVLKVDNFLNHQIDVSLLQEMGKEFGRLFRDCGVNKILTVEASGIGVACITAQYFDCCPVVFAKKSKHSNVADDVYSAVVHSYTQNVDNTIIVSDKYLGKGDNVLIIDDFLANGEAINGMCELIKKAGATLVGAGICIEKAYQPGGKKLRSDGVRIESLARIKAMSSENGIEFC